jgi:hypothetical protein
VTNKGVWIYENQNRGIPDKRAWQSRNTKQAIQNNKKSNGTTSTMSTLQQQHISLGIGIDPDTAEISNHPITTLRIPFKIAYFGSLTCNLHHSTVTFNLINNPSRANLVVRIVSCVTKCQYFQHPGCLAKSSDTHLQVHQVLHCARSTPRLVNSANFPVGLLGRSCLW